MGAFVDRTGLKYGKLTVIEKTDKRDAGGSVVWRCKCDCGNIIDVSGNALTRQKSCGCAGNRFDDLTGKSFGRLKVTEYVGKDEKGHTTLWKCLCSCGSEKIFRASCLKNGTTVSCGCYNIERIRERSYKHGIGNEDRLYRIWSGMKHRCYTSGHRSYKDYGERGIKVCDEWRYSFLNFREWALANGYSDKLSIDRIDVNGDYTPDNCRWATATEQANNTRNNVYLTYKRETHTLAEWGRISGINPLTLAARKRSGWSDEECLEIPPSQSNNQNTRKRNR